MINDIGVNRRWARFARPLCVPTQPMMFAIMNGCIGVVSTTPEENFLK